MSHKYSEESALEVLAKAEATPLEPYPGNMAAKWKCQCASCGQVIFPRMVNLARGSRACRYCYGPNSVNPKEAELAMIAAGVEPLEPYPGYDKPWKVRCPRCGGESTPMYRSIKKGQGGCFRCANDYGDAPAHVYLVHDSSRGVVKIGITNEHAHRMTKYSNWNVVEFFRVPTGRLASDIEAEVLRKWRTDLGLPPKLTRNEMPDKGYTETADEVGLNAALCILEKHKHAHTNAT